MPLECNVSVTNPETVSEGTPEIFCGRVTSITPFGNSKSATGMILVCPPEHSSKPTAFKNGNRLFLMAKKRDLEEKGNMTSHI